MKNTITTTNLVTIANAIVENSGYTIEEIKAAYKSNRSESYRRGFFAAHGMDWLQGQIVEQELIKS